MSGKRNKRARRQTSASMLNNSGSSAGRSRRAPNHRKIVSCGIAEPSCRGAPPVSARCTPSVPPTIQPQIASNSVIPAITKAEER